MVIDITIEPKIWKPEFAQFSTVEQKSFLNDSCTEVKQNSFKYLFFAEQEITFFSFQMRDRYRVSLIFVERF